MTKCMCGGKLQQRSITLNEVILGISVRVEGAPALVCPECGEEYVSGAFLERLEAIVGHRVSKENAGKKQQPQVIDGRHMRLAKAL